MIVSRLCFLIIFFFSLTNKISAFTVVLLNMKSLIFDLRYFYFYFYCFHYLNRSYGQLPLFMLKTSKSEINDTKSNRHFPDSRTRNLSNWFLTGFSVLYCYYLRDFQCLKFFNNIICYYNQQFYSMYVYCILQIFYFT